MKRLLFILQIALSIYAGGSLGQHAYDRLVDSGGDSRAGWVLAAFSGALVIQAGVLAALNCASMIEED
jgi:hypothetical protein